MSSRQAVTQVGGEVGEVRRVKHAPAGLHFGSEVNLAEFAEGCLVDGFPEGCDPKEEREALREALSSHLEKIVSENYAELSAKIDDKRR